MEEHIERTCAGLRALAFKGQSPDVLLYISDDIEIEGVPNRVSGIPVYSPAIKIDPYQFGTVMPIKYIPCSSTWDMWVNLDFQVYKRAYEDYNCE